VTILDLAWIVFSKTPCPKQTQKAGIEQIGHNSSITPVEGSKIGHESGNMVEDGRIGLNADRVGLINGDGSSPSSKAQTAIRHRPAESQASRPAGQQANR
jgi:hypothetical protein